MNKVLLTGRLTRDPELRVLASGKNVTTFSVAMNEYVGNGKEKAEFHSVVAWVSRMVRRTGGRTYVRTRVIQSFRPLPPRRLSASSTTPIRLISCRAIAGSAL